MAMKLNTDFIQENIATTNARRIGLYDVNGNRVGQMPLDSLQPPTEGKKLYTFGVLSDVHIGDSTAENDFQAALEYLNEKANFVCISGDLTHTGTEEQRNTYKSIIETHSSIPVYAVSGNHDGQYIENLENVIASYTGQPLYYSITYGNDVFIFVGNATGSRTRLFTTAELQWLYETLEANRNKRCFLFQHVRPDDTSGNTLNIYTYDIWEGTEQTIFENLLKHYKNVIFFHGHSHLKYDLQKYSDMANLDRKYGRCSVHVSSITVPRSTSSAVDTSIVGLYAESEGYVVDVYESGIHLRGRDFIKGEYLPIASYWIDTTPQEIAAKTYNEITGV